MAYIRINIQENRCPSYSYPVVQTIQNKGTYVFTESDFTLNYSDPEGDAFGGIKLISGVTEGQLYLKDSNGVGQPVSGSASNPVTITKAQINNGDFYYVAPQNNPNAVTVDIYFQTCDENWKCCDGHNL